jgi:hypothetical protein
MHVHECPRTVAAVQVIVCVHVIIVVLMYTQCMRATVAVETDKYNFEL